MIYRFGRFELDEERGELRRDGKTVAIQPKPLELLRVLLSERSRVVPHDELMERLWPDTVVTTASLTRAVSHARRAIGDTGRGALIRSFSRRGYRFCGDVLDRVAPADAAPPSAETRAPRAEPFVGRTDALARLRDTWSRARAGAGAVLLLTGRPGIGKTRLAQVFADEARSQKGLVLVGRSREGDGAPPLWLWAQILRQLFESGVVDDPASALGPHAGELAALLPELKVPTEEPPRVSPSAEESRFLLFDSVTRLLVQASRRRPVVLVLEDLQWAGSPALRLLEHLAFEIDGARLLVLATVRDEPRDPGHPLVGTLEVLRRRPETGHVALATFSRAEVAALVAESMMGGSPPAELVSTLYARTEGVPLFVREAIRLLGESGALGRPDSVAAESLSLPLHAVDWIRRALSTLPAEAAALVAAAAVIGREFSLRFAAEVADQEPATALGWLDDAIHSQVIEPDPEQTGRYRFAHALFREATLDGLAPSVLTWLHQRAARHLAERHADDLEPVLSELADHALRGIAVGDPDTAFDYVVRAAQQAERSFAYDRAARHYENALVALEHGDRDDPDRRIETWLALGRVLRETGDHERRREVLQLAMERTRALDRDVDFARAAIGLCDIADWTPRDEEGRRALLEALDRLGDAEVTERTRVLTRLAFFALPRSQEEAQELARRAVTLARRQRDLEALHEALYGLHYVVAGPDHFEERAALAGELSDAADTAPNREPALIALLDVASDRLVEGDAEGAQRYREQAGHVAGDRPHLALRWHLRVFDAGLAQLRGELARADALANEARTLGERLGHPYTRIFYGAYRLKRAFDQGPIAEAEAQLVPAFEDHSGPDTFVVAALARARLALGRREDALALFESLAKEGFRTEVRNIRWLGGMVEAGLLCAELGDVERAERLASLLAPHAGQHAVFSLVVCYGGPVTRCLARLAAVRGAGDEAVALTEEALAQARGLGARPMEAKIRAELGGLLRRRQPGRARALLEEALDAARGLGLAELEARVRRSLSG